MDLHTLHTLLGCHYCLMLVNCRYQCCLVCWQMVKDTELQVYKNRILKTYCNSKESSGEMQNHIQGLET